MSEGSSRDGRRTSGVDNKTAVGTFLPAPHESSILTRATPEDSSSELAPLRSAARFSSHSIARRRKRRTSSSSAVLRQTPPLDRYKLS